MRICHVIESAAGGSAHYVARLAGEFIKHGHDVTVIYSPDRADEVFLNSLKALPTLRLQPLLMRRSVGLHDVLGVIRLYACLRRLGPFDVIHSHSSKAGALARVAGLALPGRQVYTPHAFYSMTAGASAFYGRVESMLSHISDAIITVSTLEERHARQDLHIDPRRLHRVPNGIPMDYPADRATARQAMGYDEGDCVLGFIGRFVPQKNTARLLEAMARIKDVRPDLKFALVGDGPLQAEIDAGLQKLKLNDQTRVFQGRVGRDLVPGFDGLLCSSDYEGFATVFLEALAAGVPIATTPVGGAHEAVLEGETGFMSPDFSTDNLVQAFTKLAMLGVSERIEMSQNARIHARNFTLERMADGIEKVYKIHQKTNNLKEGLVQHAAS